MVCKCGEANPEMFYKSGRRRQCKACISVVRKAWRVANPEIGRRLRAAYRARNKDRLREKRKVYQKNWHLRHPHYKRDWARRKKELKGGKS